MPSATPTCALLTAWGSNTPNNPNTLTFPEDIVSQDVRNRLTNLSLVGLSVGTPTVDPTTHIFSVNVTNGTSVGIQLTGEVYDHQQRIVSYIANFPNTPIDTSDQTLVINPPQTFFLKPSESITIQLQGDECCNQFDVSVSGVDTDNNGTIDKSYIPLNGTTLVAAAVTTGWIDNNNNGKFDTTSVDTYFCPEEHEEGRVTGGGFINDATYGKVTYGFELHCNAGIVPNNLEVNWGGSGRGSSATPGQNWHLDTLVSASCFEITKIDQSPPKSAPIDTYVGVGLGSYNGVSGYPAVWTLVDAGEPGTSDKITLTIYDKNSPNTVLLHIDGFVDGGNIQTHTENKSATVTPPPLSVLPTVAITEYMTEVDAAKALALNLLTSKKK